jgi:probable rRNA maturation factor
VARRIRIRAAAGDRASVRWVRRHLERFLEKLALDQVELSVWLCRDAEIRRLNRFHRGKDQATDVLSFPAARVPGRGLRPIGDLAISMQTARRRARSDRRPLRDEVDRYLAHGLLHLMGYDHHRGVEAHRMARVEQDLLGGRGMVEYP